MTPADFAIRVMQYCRSNTGSVTSWGRTAAHNARVGGIPDSPHLVWLGADVVYDYRPLLAVARASARELGLAVIHEPTHDHLQPLTILAGPPTRPEGR